MFKKILLVLLFLAISAKFSYCLQDNSVTVYCNKDIGRVNTLLYGNNFIAYDPSTYEDWGEDYYGYSDYGAGIWNPKGNTYVKEVVDLAKEIKMSVARFPGGCGAHHYDWKKAVGDNRKHFLYGLDEYFASIEPIGAIPLITVSYFSGDEKDAADLVEYLNAACDGTNPNGGIDWAKQRSKNGHHSPYDVKYFEFGNEVYHGDHRMIKEVDPAEYADRYLRYYTAMKDVDPSIQIGVVLGYDEWDRPVLEAIKDKIDFGIVHLYPAPEANELTISLMNPKDIVGQALDMPEVRYRQEAERILAILDHTAAEEVPLAVTEYNAGFIYNDPPYRHSLGAALVNAELMRLFMKPQYRVMMANYWQFSNSYWGMVYTNGDYMKYDYSRPIEYIKRPNYFTAQLYAQHFGNILLEHVDATESLTVNVSRNPDTNKIYLMVVNKNMETDVPCKINLVDFEPDRGSTWTLNGPTVAATNENNPYNVKVVNKALEIEGESFVYLFPAHSLTAIEIEGKNL